MAKLILEEAGTRRAFRFKDGKLTIGSAESCTLTLESAGVEPHHATLLLKGGQAVLSTTAGAEAPLVDGRPASARQELPGSCSFSIGEAVFQLELDAEAASGAAPAKRASATRGPAVRKQAGATATTAGRSRGGATSRTRASATRSTRSAREAGDDDEEDTGRVSSRRREVKKGMPTWALVLLLLVGATGLAFGVKAFYDSSNVATVHPGVQLAEAGKAFNKAQYLAMRMHLDKFDSVRAEASTAQKAKADELRQLLAAQEKISARKGVLERATQELDARLKKYKDKRLTGKLASRARARVFVMRCREFRKLYPDHSEIAWVDRWEAHFAGMAKMDEPREIADLQWEVNTYTWTNPRNYKAAFEAIDEYLEYADGDDRGIALTLRDEHLAARIAHQEDRKLQMRYHWEKGETGKAMALFVYHLTMWGDEEMENQIAAEMTKLGGFSEWLKTYKKYKPETFQEICKNPYVREIAQRDGLL